MVGAIDHFPSFHYLLANLLLKSATNPDFFSWDQSNQQTKTLYFVNVAAQGSMEQNPKTVFQASVGSGESNTHMAESTRIDDDDAGDNESISAAGSQQSVVRVTCTSPFLISPALSIWLPLS